MGGSPGGTDWPGFISPIYDVNGYFTADQMVQNRATYLAALDAASPNGSGAPLSAVARGFGVEAPDVFFAYLDSWPQDAVRALLIVLRNAVEHGKPLIFGWQDVPGAISVVAPDAWPADQPIPVIVRGPHP
jgi:hypothetical protein